MYCAMYCVNAVDEVVFRGQMCVCVRYDVVSLWMYRGEVFGSG